MYRTLGLLPDVDITEQQTILDGPAETAVGVTDDEGSAIHEVVIDLDDCIFLEIHTRQVDAVRPIPAGTTTPSIATTSSVASSIPEQAAPCGETDAGRLRRRGGRIGSKGDCARG